MEDISKRSLSLTRTFDAPVALLWEVLTTPEHIIHWWGPDGFTNTIHKMELKEGGQWKFTMHGPDGKDYENEFVYREIDPMKKIILDHLKYPKFTITITLFDEGKKTKVQWLNTFDSIPGKEEAVRAFKADVGLEQNMLRLSQYVSHQTI